MESLIISMVVFAFAGAATPGPVNIVAAASGAQFGVKKALVYVVGASVSYAVVVLLCGLTIGSILLSVPEFSFYLKVAGSLFLLYLAYQIASSSPVALQQTNAKADPPGFGKGAMTQGLNPKAWLYASSGISLFVAGTNSANLYLTLLVTISLVVCFVGVAIWAVFGQAIGRWLNSCKRQRMFNVLMGLLLAITVAGMWWE
ncbi:Putative threonine/lysine efflux protein family [Vibrio nigripulchritudo SFn27]|uniref:Putative threonine/lysine efflux protein family n=1 Tax=Vibrio nigripulchritudo TaxID=28173 RepID=U4KEN1_9VIBR|nr:LysE family translocator [Vibrio nigripulchritudo]CCN82905.1 Putative threonine/lysine efflux protein family [Vibrio nigripulchritudo BLFn1]CCN89622.1 Putative threonine/lysine efflux protein family [Vibrio nigripulchritudo SFn27]CCN94419.1 Putative threonine/lysine efflux protein family [Vibrio nigripulchritudo ENn2]CCO39801.1 Putative threonine/lysine efflux protein family [Vibrio nigripulchritudo SFn135]CCO52286.1 Putative threonine/lysine efflux protein family [Vibrio nigripulchritudo W